MENEQANKMLLGKILGEIYRLQKRTKNFPCTASNGQIFGLLNGFEEAIDEQINYGWVSNKKVKLVSDALDEYELDPEKKKEFTGFYSIEFDLKSQGLSRSEIMQIVQYFRYRGHYVDLIKRMDSSGSPAECRNFDIDEDEV